MSEHDVPTRRLRLPVARDEDGPEYLTTGWSIRPAEPPAPEYGSDPGTGTAVTVWQTQVVSGVPVGAAPTAVGAETKRYAYEGAAAAWRGGRETLAGRRGRRRTRPLGWLLPVLVLVVTAVGVHEFRVSSPLAVEGLTARAVPAQVPCAGTADISAVATTNGEAGSIRYRWLRSDGSDSGELEQVVHDGQTSVRLTLSWTFRGRGTYRARATVTVSSPTPRTATARVTYRCP